VLPPSWQSTNGRAASSVVWAAVGVGGAIEVKAIEGIRVIEQLRHLRHRRKASAQVVRERGP
jgi:hypothetical protein